MKINKPISYAKWKNPPSVHTNGDDIWGLNTLYGIDVEAELIRVLTEKIDKSVIDQLFKLEVTNTGLPMADDRLEPGISTEDMDIFYGSLL